MKGRLNPEVQRRIVQARWAKPGARERQAEIIRAKWAQARAEGKTIGRPPSLDDLGGTRPVSLVIAADDHALLKITAQARNITMSELIRTYIDHGLELDASIHKYKSP